MRIQVPLALLWITLCATPLFSQTVLLDDFTRADDPVVGNGWSETETSSTGAQIFSNQLLCGSTTAGREWVYQDVSAHYTTNGLSSNSGTLTWAFNFKSSNTNPSGFDTGNYGIAVCLGSTSSDFALGSGYAVVIGQSGTTDLIRLAHFTGGMDLNSNFTNIISGGDYGNEYISVRVTYEPSTNNWALYAESASSGSGAFPQSDPRNTATQIGSTTSNSTYTSGNDLRYLGTLWNHNTSGTENARYDDIYCPSIMACTPPGTQASAFSTANASSSTLDVNWVRGTGDNVLVVARQGSAVNANPASGTTYNADAAFGSGDQIGTGNYVVYNGTSTSVTVTGLSASTTYHFAIYEYNNTGVCYLSPALTGNGSTTAAPPLYFQSRQSGSWASVNTWESSVDGSTWSNATTVPNAAIDLTITILSPHEVNIPDDVTLDQVVVNEGATLKIDNITDLTFSNGTGVDLDINGTYHDNATAANTASFNTGATWRQGPNSTFLKTNDSGSSIYRDAYEGGITNMPATAYWILRDIGITLPSVSNMTYPNLTIENYTGATITCAFSGSSGFPTIKGNFDVGGNGSGEVIFDNLNTHATPCLVLGNVTVRSIGLLDNYSGTTYGTGFEVRGNITSEGFFDLTGGTGSKGTLLLSGSNAQTITGAGTVDANTLIVNKSAGEVTLSSLPQQLWAHLNLTLTNRNIVLGNEVLRLLSGGTLSGGSASSYIKTDGTGYFERNVNNAETFFPVGNSGYNPLWLTNSAAADDRFKVRVFDDVLTNGSTGAPITTQVVDRTWIVDETLGGNTITMKVQWNGGDELTGFTRSACYVSHYTGSGWSDDTPGTAAGAGPYTRTRMGITTFSPFAVASDGQLPIELTHFRATPQGRSVLLEWATQMERDNAYFAIERSTDGQHFQQIGSQPSLGNSRTLQAYDHTDLSPLPGLNYYRLRQTDHDGHFTYSPVVKARIATTSLQLMSTIVSSQLQAVSPQPLDTDARWQIVDALGQVLQSGRWAAESAQCLISVSDLAAGQYWLQVATEGDTPVALQFHKQ